MEKLTPGKDFDPFVDLMDENSITHNAHLTLNDMLSSGKWVPESCDYENRGDEYHITIVLKRVEPAT